MSKFLKILVGFAISGLCLWVVFRGFQSQDLMNALNKASTSWFIAFAVVYLFNQLCRTYRWKIFLTPLKTVSTAALFPVLLFGFFMNNILPARGGEFVRAYVAHRRFELNVVSVFGSIVAERLSDFFGLFIIILISCRVLPLDRVPVKLVASIFLAGTAVAVFSVWFVQKNKNRTVETTGLKRKILDLFTKAVEGFLALKSAKMVGLVGVLSVMIWLNEALMVLIISKVIGLNLGFIYSTAVIVGISIGVMIPAGPGFIGTFEFFSKQMLQFLGYGSSDALNLVLILHFTQVVCVSICGLISLAVIKKSAPGISLGAEPIKT